MAIQRTFEFNCLPLETRASFASKVNSTSPEDGAILCEKKSLLGTTLASIMLLLFVALLVLAPFLDGVGVLGGRNALLDVGTAIYFFVLLAFSTYNILATWRQHQLKKALPFVPGKYLFAFDLVDARTPTLKIFSLEKLKDLQATHQSYYFIYSHTKFTFKFESGSNQEILVKDKRIASDAIRILNEKRAQLRVAFEQSDMATLERLDPFISLRMAEWKTGENAGASGRFSAQALPPFFKWRAAIAPVAAALLVLLAVPPRNYVSDERQYAEARQLGSEQAYQKYLQTGWRHKPEITSGLPTVVFADAKKTGTVTAFRAFLKRYPKSDLEAAAKKEISAIYRNSLERFKLQAATSDPALIPLMESVLALLEAQGNSSVQVRFTRPSSDALEKVDLRIKNSRGPLEIRTVAPITPHFSSDSAAARERRITSELSKAFNVIFPNDVLQVSAPQKIDSRLPVFDIAYEVSPSGTLYSSKDGLASLRMFVGITVKFDATLSVPGNPAARRLKFDVLPPDTFSVKTTGDQSGHIGQPDDSNIYVTMADRAFDQLGVKLRSAFFNADSNAFRQSSRK